MMRDRHNAMTMVLGGIPASPVQDSLVIRRQLRRLRLRSQMIALLLIAPLFLFLMLIFVAPIALLLARGIDNGEVARILPRTAAALVGWDGAAMPDEGVFAALAADLKAAPREAIAEAAREAELPGARPAFGAATKRAPAAGLEAPPYREQPHGHRRQLGHDAQLAGAETGNAGHDRLLPAGRARPAPRR